MHPEHEKNILNSPGDQTDLQQLRLPSKMADLRSVNKGLDEKALFRDIPLLSSFRKRTTHTLQLRE